MRHDVSLGFVMIAMGVMSVGALGGQRPLGPAAYVIAGVLVLAGIVLMTRRRFSFHIAIAASTLLAISGVVAYAGRPELALPVPPWVSVVVGLYLCLRIAMGKAFGSKPRVSEE